MARRATDQFGARGRLVSAAITAILLVVGAYGQTTGPGSRVPGPGCSCGAHPPGPQPDRTVKPYARTPEDLEPYGRFAKPYYENYTTPNLYSGAARQIPDPGDVKEVRIGFLGPVAGQADQVYGLRMLHGAQMAIDEANARGGYGGKPFRLMAHDDYSNWQFGAEAGEQRPTDSAVWGAPIDEAVRMIYDEGVWAIFGSISSESTHMVLRLVLKAETPLVNSASTDPTVPETYIPWYFTDVQDDRVQAYTLARHIYTELGLKRTALLRVNNRYGRMAAEKFRAASVRLGHPVAIEQKFLPGDTDFSHELRILRDSRVDAVVLWADQPEAAGILRQMRAVGMKQRVFGAYRTLGADLLAEAGPAAEGFEAVYPYDPSRTDPRWLAFQQRYEARFGKTPEQFAALAYDAMNILLQSICRAGLNRGRIQDALDRVYEYDGVTGHMVFDPNEKNVAPLYLGTVHNGAITYRLEPMDAPSKPAPHQAAAKSPGALPQIPLRQAAPPPYARVGQDGVSYWGPHAAALPRGPIHVVLFGPDAAQLAGTPAMRAAMRGAPQWILDPIESKQNWGTASTQLVHALLDEHVLAIIALNRDAAHLSEQMALKCFVPVIAFSDDQSLTSAAIPWIFRLPASTAPAAAVRVLRAAEAEGGSNPERVRQALASGLAFAGAAFQPDGELRRP